MIKTGIIGYGLSGRVFHAPFIDVVEGFELTAISTTNKDGIKLIKQRYPLTKIVHGADDIINDPEIDLVIITSPNTVHFSQAKESLLAGKHVVIEKPFTNTSAEADELIEISKREGKILTAYHNRRFVSDTKTVKKIFESGILGEVIDFEAHFDRFRPEPRGAGNWRENPLPGSGIFYDLGSHLIDQALHFFGLPKAVTAHIKSQRPWAKADDCFDVKLHYPTLTATLKSSMLVNIPGPTFQIHGTKGSYVKYGLDVQEENLNNGMIPNTPDWGKEPEEIWGKLVTEVNGMKISSTVESENGDYREYFINLRDTILGKTELAVKPEEARNVIRVIELAFQSSNEGRTVEFV
ncbi:MAG: Gfo/Idh/MocA family oxidoreductase [Porphyromonadaceae bacterium]|nr:Gfo/Idh/MocA family oxidoreductase [Porphyromonadaceae bacterium]